MTAPEREALVKRLGDALRKVRPLGGSELFMKFGDGYVVDPDYCGALIEQMHRDLHEAHKTIARLRKAEAPAVTVTEERVTRAAETLNNYTVSDRFPCSERDAVLEEAAREGDRIANSAKTIGRKWSAQDVAAAIRALKSTTPQTGSQE